MTRYDVALGKEPPQKVEKIPVIEPDLRYGYHYAVAVPPTNTTELTTERQRENFLSMQAERFKHFLRACIDRDFPKQSNAYDDYYDYLNNPHEQRLYNIREALTYNIREALTGPARPGVPH